MPSKSEKGQRRIESQENSATHRHQRLDNRTLVIFLIILVVLLIGGLIVAVVVLQNNQRVIYINVNECKTANCYDASSIILGSINTSFNSCNDFYQYACGGWLAKNDLPEDRVTYTTFGAVLEKKEKILRRVLAVNYTT